MTNIRSIYFYLLLVGSLSLSASAQVRFNVVSNPYAGSGVSISVGNGGYCQQPVYNTGYAVYPAVRTRGRRQVRRPVVYPVVNTGYGYYNNGYYATNQVNYNPGYNQGYYNQGAYNPGYNQGYNNQGYNQGYYSNGRCR